MNQDLKEINLGETRQIVDCKNVKVSNYAWVVSQYALINVENNVKGYESGHYMRRESWSFDLGELNIYEGTQFDLKAEVEAGNDCTADVILRYNPQCDDTIIFELRGTAFDTSLTYMS